MGKYKVQDLKTLSDYVKDNHKSNGNKRNRIQQFDSVDGKK